jgi:hypothetical protein
LLGFADLALSVGDSAEFVVGIKRVEPSPILALADGGATDVAAGAQRQPAVLDGGGAVAVRAQPTVASMVAGMAVKGS